LVNGKVTEEMNEEIEIFEETEVEEIEFSMSEDEIDEWISELMKLKEEKGQVVLSVDDETDLKINYEENEEEDDDA
jgi:hypothetical protein